MVLVFVFTPPRRSPAADTPQIKKLIKYGWDAPDPTYVAAHIREMEERPFDGIIMKMAGKYRGHIFLGGRWNPDDYAADMRAMGSITWGRFKSNFLMMYSTSEQDWFSDEDWNAILHNVGIVAQTARRGGCSLAFDPEPYGSSPWNYTTQRHADSKSYREYADKVRDRGRQFIEAIGMVIPENVLLSFFTFSIFEKVMNIAEPGTRQSALEAHRYGLYLPFLIGILDGLGPRMIVVDGNEPSFYYADSEKFLLSRTPMRVTALNLVPAEDRAVFLERTRAAQAVYPDLIFAEGPWKNSRGAKLHSEEQSRWFEHNVYWALKTADEYVWLYSEQRNWWQSPDLVPGLTESIDRVRKPEERR
jgi:hypothetical protein